MRIRQLPPAIANQIAAGEVIERPASVVKELLENALDAGADQVAIEIGYGGLNQIKISDNGAGILAEDLPLALSAHATSKISTLDDLYAIGSMGFRGEALASIASISKLTISSKPAQQDHAMKIEAMGDKVSISPCARLQGTTVDVVDIFFNAPVRKRFLKSERIEYQAIETVVKRFALSAEHIAISLKHNGKQMLSLPAVTTNQARINRMGRIFGNPFVQDAIYIDVEQSGMALSGWVSGKQFQRSQNDRLWVYINQRMVRDKLILQALKQTYDGMLHPGRFPACLLYLTMDRAQVDVNVHPTKHEVRFQQPRLVHDFFTSQLGKALSVLKSEPVMEVYNVSEPVPDFKKSYYSQEPIAAPIHQGSDEQGWVILNKTHVLMVIDKVYYLVDGLRLYQQWVLEQLEKNSGPMPSRPLLVPIRYESPSELVQDFDRFHAMLSACGIVIEQRNPTTVEIKSIPVLCPYLDLRALFDAIFLSAAGNAVPRSMTSSQELLQLKQTISKNQALDLRTLSPEERAGLQEWLRAQPEPGRYAKSLTEEHCRVFLDA